MQTLGDVLKKATLFLKEKGTSEPRLCAEWLLAFVLKLNRLDLYLNFERPLIEEELVKYRAMIARRARHEPISYIMGAHPFYGLNLKVSPAVLIPRHETEELVGHVLKRLPFDQPLTGLDLCTGSGAIACALKKERPDLILHASDISQEALDIAQVNALEHKLQIPLHRSDLVESIDLKFDFIVCNPPYIVDEYITTLERQVKEYEPHLALKGGSDGLEFYRKLHKSLPKVCKPGALLFFEIGYDQGDVVVALFSEGPYANASCIKDAQLNNRFVFVRYNALEE